MRAYVKADPVALVYSGVDRDSRYLGYSAGLGGGLFRAYEGFAFALGVRLNYGFLRELGQASSPFAHFLHAGPELRLGKAGERVFGFFLLRGGYTHWADNISFRESVSPGALPGGHLGVGGGAWGRAARRLLAGGEAAVDIHFILGVPVPMLNVSLSLGAWL